MSSTNTIHKTKLTITIGNDVSNEIDGIAKRRGIPRSQIMEEILRDWLSKSKRKTIEKGIRDYYLSITEEEKEENSQWTNIAAENVKRTWND